jgi:hypothetical protein
MPDAAMEFSNAVSQELFRLLEQRAGERLAGLSDMDRFTATLGATLLVVAEVLRDKVEQGASVQKVVDFSARWLTTFLEPTANAGREQEA